MCFLLRSLPSSILVEITTHPENAPLLLQASNLLVPPPPGPSRELLEGWAAASKLPAPRSALTGGQVSGEHTEWQLG